MIRRIRENYPVIYLVLMFIVLTLYSLIFAELFLRIFSPVPILPRYVKGMEYGIRGNIGGIEYTHITPEYKIKIRTNQKGIRADYEIPYEKPQKTIRIVILGDSFAMGYGVELEDSFTEQMSIRLEELTGKEIEIVNLASSGHGNAEELLVLENEGIKYDPDMVMLCWHGSDLTDNIRSGLYEIKDNQLRRKQTTYLPGVHMREMLFSIPMYEFIATKSQLYNKIRDTAGRYVKGLLLKANSLMSKSETVEQGNLSEIEPVTTTEELSYFLINEIKDITESLGAEFYILDIPNRLSRTKFISQFPTDINNEFDEDLLYYSPIDDFNDIASSDVKLYWERSHGHFTPLACEIVGTGMAEYILSKTNKIY